MYCCPRLDLTGNFPVWSVYMVWVWSYYLMKMSFISSVISLIVGDSCVLGIRTAPQVSPLFKCVFSVAWGVGGSRREASGEL